MGKVIGRRLILALCGVWLLSWGGCDGNWTGQTVEDGNVGLDPQLFPAMRIQGEPNDTFGDPVGVVIDSGGRGHLQGTIATPDDVDVYELGPMSAGDRLIVDVSTESSYLDAALAVFDEQGRIAFENDDRNYDLMQYDPFLNDVVRHDSEVYYLAIFRAPLDTYDTTGSYEVLITIVRGGQVPPAESQSVVLNFTGGTVTIPGDATYRLGPFDTADISPSYAGLTEAVRRQIAANVQENFEGLALDLRMLPGDSLPAAGTYSTLYFGGSNVAAFGISEDIDPFNSDHGDYSIIFTEMFTPEQFGRVLSAAELGTAIGNIAAHELGHLLGLNHVANVLDLMDTTGDTGTFLLDQDFMNSPLDDSVCPLGTQDALLLLLETLGGASS